MTASQGSKPEARPARQTPGPHAPALPAQAGLGVGLRVPTKGENSRSPPMCPPILPCGASALGEETLPQLCRPSNQVQVVALNTKLNI